MGSPYQSQSASNYNSSPPPDDGSTVAANKITWAGIKSKLADSIKTLADAMNTALRAALNVSPITTSTAYTTLVSDHLTTIEVTGTTTISLGDAVTMIAQSMGYTVTVYNKGTNLVTVTPVTAGDTLDGTAGGSVVIPPKGSLTFTVAQSGVGYDTIGSNTSNKEALWTPVLTAATPGDLSVTYGTQFGIYTKIGRQVTVQFFIQTSAFTHTTASGNAYITGLPFTVLNTTGYAPIGPLTFSGITVGADYEVINLVAVLNTTRLEGRVMGSAKALANLDITALPTGGSVILAGSINYFV